MNKLTCTLLLLFFTLPVAATMPAQAQEYPCAPGVSLSAGATAAYVNDVTADVASITAYWNQTYPNVYGGAFPGVCATVEYTVPDIPFSQTCGLTHDIASMNAFYCIPAESVMWDGPDFFHPIYEVYGDKAITYIVAHEYGHAAQFLSGSYPPGPRTVNIEIQADCLAGAYFQYEVNNGLMSTEEAHEVIVIAAQFGQSRFGTRWIDRSHGTSTQRLAALHTGFEGGASICLNYEPDPQAALNTLQEQIEQLDLNIDEEQVEAWQAEIDQRLNNLADELNLDVDEEQVDAVQEEVQERIGELAEQRATQGPRHPGSRNGN
jgi:predicted metalloprotease